MVVDLDIESVFRQRLMIRAGGSRATDRETVARHCLQCSASRCASRPIPPAAQSRSAAQPLADDAEIYHALVLGTRDYVRKNGFKKVVLGLSGGIDSALTA